MNCLIFNPYGNLEGEGWKEYRSTMIAKALVRRDSKCTIFAPLIEHRAKRKRNTEELKSIANENGYDLVFSCFFLKYGNRRLSRVFHEVLYSISFLLLFLKYKRLRQFSHIICVEPAPFSSWLMHIVKRLTGAVLVYDVLDLFPETIETTEKRYLTLLKKPIEKLRSFRLSDAEAIVYCSKTFEDALAIDKVPSEVIYLGCDNELNSACSEYDNKIIERTREFLKGSRIKIVYAGSYGDSYGLDKFIEEIKSCFETIPGIKFCLYGLGDERQVSRIHETIGDSDAISEFGAISPAALKVLFAFFDAGVISYSKGTSVAMPVKFFDYAANELFILNNCPGEVSELIDKNALGKNFSFEWSGLDSYLSTILDGASSPNVKFDYQIYRAEVQHEKFVDFIETIVA